MCQDIVRNADKEDIETSKTFFVPLFVLCFEDIAIFTYRKLFLVKLFRTFETIKFLAVKCKVICCV